MLMEAASVAVLGWMKRFLILPPVRGKLLHYACTELYDCFSVIRKYISEFMSLLSFFLPHPVRPSE